MEKAKFVKHHISLCFCQLRLLLLWEVYSYNEIIVLGTLKSWHSYLEQEWALSEYFSLVVPCKGPAQVFCGSCWYSNWASQSGRAPTEVINLGTSIRPQLFVSERQFLLSSLEKLWRLFNRSWHDGDKEPDQNMGPEWNAKSPHSKALKVWMHCILSLNWVNKWISCSLNIAGHKMEGIAGRGLRIDWLSDWFACILFTEDNDEGVFENSQESFSAFSQLEFFDKSLSHSSSNIPISQEISNLQYK